MKNWSVFFVSIALLLGSQCAVQCAVAPNICAVTQVKVPAGTPGDQLCQAELDAKAIARFQKFLIQYGHTNLKVLAGTAYATAAGVKAKTFTVCLKCVTPNGNVFAVGIKFVKDNLEGIEIIDAEERMLPS